MRNLGDLVAMEGSGKNVVYVRRGDSDKKSDWKEDGKEIRRGDEGGKGKHRFEGKLVRKRGLKEVTEKQDVSKLGKANSDRMDPSPREGGKVLGKYKSMERKFKEIPGGGEERRGKVFNSKREKDRDGASNGAERRREIVGRGKRSVRHFKGSKVPNRTLSSKLKVRVGGVGSSMHSESLGKGKQGLGSSADGEHTESRAKKSAEPVKKRRHRLILQDNSDDDDYYPRPTVIKKDVNVPRSPNDGADDGKELDDDLSVPMAGHFAVSGASSHGVRKSSRVPKKKVLEDFEDDVPDVGMAENSGDPKSLADEKAERDDSESSDEKEVGVSGGDVSESDPDLQDLEATLSKQPKSSDALPAAKTRNAPLTARQRTMQLGKDGDNSVGLNLIEFPAGLTQLTRRGTQKLTVEERQVKKAEAANRRKQVVERAAHEMQASAIQKILGQDSSRKRKEERLQKQREEIEQEKKAAAREMPSNSVRWTNGPNGVTVSWSEDVELPSIFSPRPSVYPPPKQECAAPLCNNPYNYRDSKSNLPLCSLRCYDIMRPAAALITTS